MVQQVSKPRPQKTQEKAICRHHWVIEAPTGPESRGACQLCGEVREFKNYIASAPWVEEPAANKSSGRYPVSPESEDDEGSYEA